MLAFLGFFSMFLIFLLKFTHQIFVLDIFLKLYKFWDSIFYLQTQDNDKLTQIVDYLLYLV